MNKSQMAQFNIFLFCPFCGYKEKYNPFEKLDYCSLVEIVIDMNKMITVTCLSCNKRIVCSDNLVIERKQK